MNEKERKAWQNILRGNMILNSEDAVKLYEENTRLQAKYENLRMIVEKSLPPLTDEQLEHFWQTAEQGLVGLEVDIIHRLIVAVRMLQKVNEELRNELMRITEEIERLQLQEDPESSVTAAIDQRDEKIKRLEQDRDRLEVRVGYLVKDTTSLQNALQETMQNHMVFVQNQQLLVQENIHLEAALHDIPKVGHNDNCIFCALKDKLAMDALTDKEEEHE